MLFIVKCKTAKRKSVRKFVPPSYFEKLARACETRALLHFTVLQL